LEYRSDILKMADGSKTWTLEAETEYRFELDPGSSLAIKVG
jgi:hypothetical protein